MTSTPVSTDPPQRLPDLPGAGHGLPEDDVALEKTRLLFQNTGMAQVVVVLNGGVLVFILGGLAPPAWALAWWLAMMAVSAARYDLARRFRAASPVPAEAPLWRRRALIGALVAGLLSAAGCIAMMVADPESTRLFAALVMAGMVAGAVPILSSVPGAYRAYAVPVMSSIIATALLDAHGSRDWMLAFVATLYLLALLRSARHFHDSLDSSIRLAQHMRFMAEQLEAAHRGAKAASAAKSQFLATVSHEIRTPMNGILGMAQLLLMPEISVEERREYAHTILDSGRFLLTLLNDILDLSKVEAGKLELARAELDPGLMMDEVAVLFGETARSKGLAIETAWRGPAGRSYWADPLRLRQILANLVSNAIKFTSQGHVLIEAAEVERDTGKMLEFAVVDTGIGIPRDKWDALFQPFYQVDGSNTRQFGGSGLGLSIVRNLVRLMGGEAGLESEVGKGSRFWFTIPAEPVPVDPAARHDAFGEVPDAAAVLPVRRILVVEDNGVNRAVVDAMLTKQGYNVRCVENGQEAIDIITREGFPDLVLMDCHMPVMDGLEATVRLRRRERELGLGRVPIIAVTGAAFEEDRSRCLAAGMDDVLTKPVILDELLAVIRQRLATESGPGSRQVMQTC